MSSRSIELPVEGAAASEGLLRSYMTIAGERRDMVMYALLRGDMRR